jgi:endonuclease-8
VPEGDTIHRVAERLRPALVGQPLVRFEARRANGRAPHPGTIVDSVHAVGKHLLIGFAGGITLRTHLRMSGSWHLYRTGERWRSPAHLARAVVEVPGWVAVCFAAPVVELETVAENAVSLGHLGPDLTRADVDDDAIDRALARLDALSGPTDEIGAVLLDQRVACGIGNVYKSEVLYACGVDPFTLVHGLSADTKRSLLTTAAKLLRRNVVTAGPRRTTREGVGVYGRAGRPCRRCGALVRARRQGPHARTTYWCPTCQT